MIRTQITQERANQTAQVEAAALLKDVDQYRKRLPPSPEPSWLVRETAAIARTIGLELKSITQESPLQYPQFTRLAIDIDFEATFHELGSFLDQLERSDRFIRVERINISGGMPGSKSNMRLVLSTLYIPGIAGGAAAGTPAASPGSAY